MRSIIFCSIFIAGFSAKALWGNSNAKDLCGDIKDKTLKLECLNKIKEPGFVELSKRRVKMCDKLLGRKKDSLTMNCIHGKFAPKLINVCETAAHNGNLPAAERCLNLFVGHTDDSSISDSECNVGTKMGASIDGKINCYRDQLPEERSATPPAAVDNTQR